ncbi:hypothetical protein B0A48_13885 [Cryoendolithus antarcticus]|uniref:Nucleoporin Nup54 alpha-helical domain-containing protein n=1 Tax=Cryoendolithus antarcticus TaxID=1507870 RepID=A0A1V8SLY9_9PEZI|nr:hypothetical protein B0A48_13885 [Cryoendolithus antarcticus]
MVFGRSNSLSLNTGAVNSSFASQQQQPQAPGASLFGGAPTTQTPQPQQQTGGLFGNSQPAAPQQSGGLFRNSQASQPAASGGLFGGSLFGGQNQQQPAQQAQQQSAPAGGSSLFAGGSLFGGQQQNQQQQQPAQQQQTGGSSLFGGGNSLFGQQPAQANNTNQSNSLFGNSTQQQQPQQSSSLFGQYNPNANTANAYTNPLDRPSQTSLLSASRYAQSQYQPFVTGRLSMGQGAASQPTAAPATKLDWRNIKSSTRFNDLTDVAKSDLQRIEDKILEQESFCRQIEAMLPNHEADVKTLSPDVKLISEKLEDVDQGLQADAQGVQSAKAVYEKDELDYLRCARIIENLKQPAHYSYHPASQSGRLPTASWDNSYDVDLIINYFTPLTQSMQSLIVTYEKNLAEIENHVSTVEESARLQMQQSRRQGGEVGGDSVRQLAETLRGFEESILAAAGKVGACREGVNELVVARGAARRAW